LSNYDRQEETHDTKRYVDGMRGTHVRDDGSHLAMSIVGEESPEDCVYREEGGDDFFPHEYIIIVLFFL
jgi:hypothetical protein